MFESHLPWRRHDLLRVKPSSWPRILRWSLDLADLPCATRWAERGWPVIVRRISGGDSPGMIPAAFCLPPSHGKLRAAVQLAAEDVLEPLAPVTLRAAREETPRPWRRTVDDLLALADQTKIEPRVFGSLLWQRLTGLTYLTATSDLDLLWPVDSEDTAALLTGRLAALEESSPMRLDGELLLPDGGAVQWRELRSKTSRVMVKTMGGVELRPVSTLFPARALVA